RWPKPATSRWPAPGHARPRRALCAQFRFARRREFAMTITDAFFSTAASELRARFGTAELETALFASWANAHAAFPQIEVAPETFAAFLGARVQASAES